VAKLKSGQDDIGLQYRQFSSVALEFCNTIDSASSLEKTELLVRVYEILPRLISQGIGLPSVSPGDESVKPTPIRLTNEEWRGLYESLKEKLEDWNLYWQVFDPMKDSEAIRGSLADDLADIYRELKEDISEKDASAQRAAVFGWRVKFYSHWGPHAMDALRTIHVILEPSLS
jgi:hypothetical protein